MHIVVVYCCLCLYRHNNQSINQTSKQLYLTSIHVCLRRRLVSDDKLRLLLPSNGCDGRGDEVNYLEHVQLYLDIEYSQRGALEVTLTSPQGQFNLRVTS